MTSGVFLFSEVNKSSSEINQKYKFKILATLGNAVTLKNRSDHLNGFKMQKTN